MNTDLSPTALLVRLISKIKYPHELVLVTGNSGSGKTIWCLELIHQASLAAVSPQGLVSPGVFEAGLKTGIDLQDVHTGERQRMAIRRSAADGNQFSGPCTADWQFDAGVLDWGNQLLQPLKAGDLLILDELGPLELLENQGLISGLRLVDERSYRLTCVVIRPTLLAIAQERWPWSVTLDVTNHSSALGNNPL